MQSIGRWNVFTSKTITRTCHISRVFSIWQHVTSFFTANIMTDTFIHDLHIIQPGNIYLHLLKQYLHFQKKSCQSCFHPPFSMIWKINWSAAICSWAFNSFPYIWWFLPKQTKIAAFCFAILIPFFLLASRTNIVKLFKKNINMANILRCTKRHQVA